MKFSGKMWLMIILKATKKYRFTLSLEDAFLEKPQIDPSTFSGLNVRESYCHCLSY